MDLHRFDIIEAELKTESGSAIQKKKRPYIIVGNELGTVKSGVIIIMPLTHIVKRTNLPTHECIDAESETGLSTYSMILGEIPQTIDKSEVIRKLGTVKNESQRNNVNKVCFKTFFFGENVKVEDLT